ncbi:hypothetical protein BC940DRAFT_106077 [Gongronella butleri]|nr:hypothetical protein BC940DRAFT_106077 [Gongronella butleri]
MGMWPCGPDVCLTQDCNSQLKRKKNSLKIPLPLQGPVWCNPAPTPLIFLVFHRSRWLPDFLSLPFAFFCVFCRTQINFFFFFATFARLFFIFFISIPLLDWFTALSSGFLWLGVPDCLIFYLPRTTLSYGCCRQPWKRRMAAICAWWVMMVVIGPGWLAVTAAQPLYRRDEAPSSPSSSNISIMSSSSSSSAFSTAVTDDPQDASLEEQLHDDQVALKRMIIILSLVGGLGLIAIITTIFIFARIKRQKHEKEPILRHDDDSCEYDDADDDDDDDDDDSTLSGDEDTQGGDSNSINSSLNASQPGHLSHFTPDQISVPPTAVTVPPQPSAPCFLDGPSTATTLEMETRGGTVATSGTQDDLHAYLFTTTLQQVAPSPPQPSAPPAKFLHDANAAESSTTRSNASFDPFVLPEQPPPAYTPTPWPYTAASTPMHRQTSSSSV